MSSQAVLLSFLFDFWERQLRSRWSQCQRNPGGILSHSQPDETTTLNREFLDDVVAGLSQPVRQLDCKYFYDERGSQLFDQICELDEYYLTRSELQIMNRYADEMAYQIGGQVMLVEFGSGSSIKTRILLDQLSDPVAYVPVDISEEHLLKTARKLQVAYPDVEILPVVADFTEGFSLPRSDRKPSHAAVYFPGSTIGNFTIDDARSMLERIAMVLGPQGGLLIGIDLQKDPDIIRAAYNDRQGVTAEFNLNLLRRINTELDADFELDQFKHRAEYSPESGRVEIHLESLAAQSVSIGEHSFEFREGEMILTEYSHKYTIEGFAKLASSSNFRLHKSWTDDQQRFAVLHLVNENG